MSSLTLPRPENLRVPNPTRRHLVESDVYDICERVKELSPDLYIYVLDPPIEFASKTYRYAVCELSVDGVERLVKRYEELDARIIESLQRMLSVPFKDRFAAAEREEAKYAEEFKEAELDKLYENLGRPMWSQLEHDGFMERSVSYAKSGHTGGRGSKRRS